ncbi:AAA family ATPase [Streptomyces sp. H10-C2]|uniref:AAA family ATPase n=1 Tax=unclassified Streptomyces TaxID=2593676 RepID=UPI0024BA52B5|nr:MULTISPECIES: AAA family ATPase [unclassified Streptomyces]MDJ0345794.1 AAA family ATPase [Streptomyces sp. PH10-H1]MDJ0374684.1 AAA family ATPase [Streptomyces sp. H10-C2]
MSVETRLSQTRFILPGEVPDRESAEGWTTWRLTRHSFVPAPRISRAVYASKSKRDQAIHDLHRRATHANLPLLDTPMSLAVSDLMQSRLLNNALKKKPTTRPGIMINGGGNQGKTETAAEAAAAFEDLWLGLEAFVDVPELPGARDLRATIAYVQTPVTATPKSTCQAILDFFGTSGHNMTLTQLVRQVRASLRDHRTRVLILDDITRLRMHRKDDQDTLDLIRALMSMRVTLVLIGVGIPDSGLLSGGWQNPKTGQWEFPEPGHQDWKDEAATQTARRFDLVDLRPFSYDTADNIASFVDHLTGLENELRLFNARDGMLTGGGMPEYIYRRTGGVVGLIERLIEDGASLAMDTGIEEITEELLDSVIIRTQHPKRDRAAGEEGDVPPALPAKKAVQARRARNTVFDDKGIPEITAARK